MVSGNATDQHSSMWGYVTIKLHHYRDLNRQQIYRIHKNHKKGLYWRRVLDIKHAAFTPLVLTTNGGMGKEYLMYHSRLAQLIVIKNGEQNAKPSHGSEPGAHSHSWDLLWLVLEAVIGQEGWHVTLRMLILIFKLLKERFNRTIDVFPYF